MAKIKQRRLEAFNAMVQNDIGEGSKSVENRSIFSQSSSANQPTTKQTASTNTSKTRKKKKKRSKKPDADLIGV